MWGGVRMGTGEEERDKWWGMGDEKVRAEGRKGEGGKGGEAKERKARFYIGGVRPKER